VPLNPLAPVTDYQTMLNRIFWFTTACALAATWLLRRHVPGIDAALLQLDAAVADRASGFPVSGGTLLPALVVGIATRVFRLHARVSDWLGIRESFDRDVIIGEFAEALGIDLEPIGEAILHRERSRLMRTVFYPHVSSAHPAIDRVLVEQALDAWSWFWIGIEASVLFTLTSFGLIAGGAHRVGFQVLAAALAFEAFGLPAMRGQCRRYAAAQVRAILADPQRAATARGAFAELAPATEEPVVIRRAA
jgi:hypothetical protein